MIKYFFRKINILYKKLIRAIKRSFLELVEEIYMIIRNRNYYKKYPDLFAIFSIIEQEQNPHLFDLQNKNFKIIKDNILKDNEISNHKILESLRGIFHNNNPTNDKIKDKIIKFLKKQLTQIINENNQYYFPLVKVILFSFPFLINYEDYKIFNKLLKKKSSSSLKLVKDIFDNYDNLEFLLEEKDIIHLIMSSIESNNKPSFMIMVRFLRLRNSMHILFSDKAFIKPSQILNHKENEKKGFDYLAIFLSYLENKYIDNSIEKNLNKLLQDSFSQKITPKEQAKRYEKINSYIIFAKKLGYDNSFIEQSIKQYLSGCEFKEMKTRSQISRIEKLQKSLFRMKVDPRANVRVQSIVNLTRQHPEEHWLMQFAPYLL